MKESEKDRKRRTKEGLNRIGKWRRVKYIRKRMENREWREKDEGVKESDNKKEKDGKCRLR